MRAVVSRAMPPGALEGVLVADFSRVLAGPLATMTLADLGADVVKVERPDGGDDTRAWGPPFVERGATYYLGLNRGKRSIALDLRDAADRALAWRLATRADVLVESFRTGTMERFGLGYDAVAEANPGVVYCSVTAFGADDRPGYDLLLQAMGGLMSVTGEEGGRPLKVGAAVVDLVCGLNATIGVLAALHARAADPDGRGQRVEATLMLAALSTLLNQGSAHLLAGVVPGRLGNRHPSIAPYATYEAADEPFVLAAANDALFARLCGVLGRPELAAEPRFATNAARRAHIDELDTELEGVLASRPAAEWIAAFTAAGVPAGPINDVAQAYELARSLGLGPDVVVDGLRLPGPPVALGRTPAAVRRPPPALGEHDAELRKWLAAGDG
jgi:crotonobetainyl-CoA:carnitine CoA-transferase CaiB-like acyl-CoA transferase